MQVTNLVSWAGDNFSAAPGDVLDLPDAVALARIDAGLASATPSKKGSVRKAGAITDGGGAAPLTDGSDS